MSGNKSKKIAFNYFGGKFSLLEGLYSWFPDDPQNDDACQWLSDNIREADAYEWEFQVEVDN